MTDLWPDEEGQIDPCAHVIGFFLASNTITEGYPQKLGTGAAGYIKCENSGAIGDSPGLIALKSASSGAYATVATYGVIKVFADGLHGGGNITTGEFVMSSSKYAIRMSDRSAGGTATTTFKIFGGSSYPLGLALQPSTAKDDEILILLGRTA